MSEQILLLNPRRKRRRARRHNRRRARRARRLTALQKMYFGPRRTNRRRRRRRHVARVARTFNRRRRHVMFATHRRRRRHNRRSFRGMPSARGLVGQYVMPVALGSVGAIGLSLGWSKLAPSLPAQLQSGWIGVAAKSALAIGATMLLGKYLPRYRRQVQLAGLGAVIITAAPPVMGLISSSVPGLSGYMDYRSYALPGGGLRGYMQRPATLGDLGDYYSPAATIPVSGPAPQQFAGYMPQRPSMQAHMVGGGGLMGYDYMNDGM